jgi:hypothetical protein
MGARGMSIGESMATCQPITTGVIRMKRVESRGAPSHSSVQGARRRPRVGGWKIALFPFVTLAVGGCDSLLEVDLPGNVSAEVLNNPSFANILSVSAQSDFECAFSSYLWSMGLWTNDFHPQNITRTNQIVHIRGEAVKSVSQLGSAGAQPDCRQVNPPPLYMPFHTARAQAQQAIDLITGFSDAAVPNKPLLLGRSQAYKGYSLLLLGESFCEITVNSGPVISREQAWDSATVAFTAALGHLGSLTSAEAQSLQNMARIGRARAALNRGDLAAVVSDAQSIPVGFRREVDRSDLSSHTWNRVFEMTRTNAITPTDYYFVENPRGGLRVGGVIDPRVPVEYRGFGIGIDGVTDVWRQLKYRGRGSKIPFATWREAQLMIAEAQGGQVAVDIINLLRTDPRGLHPELSTAAFPLPQFQSNNEAEIRAQVLEERRRELWMQGTRLGDMIRNGEEFRSGLTPKGEEYGPFRCMPLPEREEQANPNITG